MTRVVMTLAASLVPIAGQAVAAQDQTADQAVGTQGPPPEGWVLVWADEFDRDGPPDPRNWNCDTGFLRNRELQWYQPDNAWCEDGLLIIEARRERLRNPNYDPTSADWRTRRESADYTSASLTTSGKHSWRYGRFEMRGRIDTSAGLWPAFWTLGVAGGWPDGGEVDIMEYYRGWLLANLIWFARDTPAGGAARSGHASGMVWWDDLHKPIETFNDPDWSEKFHVWRMDWDEDGITISVDDVPLKQTRLEDTEDRQGRSPFRQPHFLLVNLAVGGQGGDPSRGTFPARMEVDYIRENQR
jgi:beta-glucanase (GH16 family)